MNPKVLTMLDALRLLLEHPGLVVRSIAWGTEYVFDGDDLWVRYPDLIEGHLWRLVKLDCALFYPQGTWELSGYERRK